MSFVILAIRHHGIAMIAGQRHPIPGRYEQADRFGLGEAIKLASMLPEVQDSHGGVEIRPVVDHG